MLRFLALVFLVPAVAAAQGTISGTVTLADGGPAQGATVFVAALNRGEMSDMQGAYAIRLPAGTHSLRFGHLGRRAERTVTLADGQALRLDVTLPAEAAPRPTPSAPPAAPAPETGCLSGDCESGYGTQRFSGQRVYTGSFADGQPEGDGLYTWPNGSRYEGGFSRGLRHGTGTMRYANRDVYVGAWRGDKPHGQGTMTYQNGHAYEGLWLDAKRHGPGRYTTPDGYALDGEWIEDAPRRGTQTTADGAVYRGEFSDFKRHGRGTFTDADGTVQAGLWQAGTFAGPEPKLPDTPFPSEGLLCLAGDCADGVGTYGFVGGSFYIGQFRDGKAHGLGRLKVGPGVGFFGLAGSATESAGNLHEGWFVGGQPHGYGVETTPEGVSSDGYHRGGDRIGLHTVRRADGATARLVYDAEGNNAFRLQDWTRE